MQVLCSVWRGGKAVGYFTAILVVGFGFVCFEQSLSAKLVAGLELAF